MNLVWYILILLTTAVMYDFYATEPNMWLIVIWFAATWGIILTLTEM